MVMITIPTKKLLQSTKHRPFPLPDKPWFIYQEWKDVLFLHTPVEPDMVNPLLPNGLSLDLISGYAWISVVLFTVNDSRMRLMPVLPLLPAFNEMNLRTYVKRDHIPGIYFLQIKADSEKAVLVNRMMTKLPYQYAQILKTPAFHYFMTAENENNLLDIDFQSGPFYHDVPNLDRWLTERYCCYQDDDSNLYRYNIHHPKWLLYNVQTNYSLLRYHFQNLFLTDQSVHLMHYSPIQTALIWQRERIA
jgi:uncharacterized protein YqjF (DUF2071 family)